MSVNSIKAEELARQQYVTFAVRDITDPKASIYLAYHPELPGCVAQGSTLKEALANLDDVRIDYIEHLLDHGLPVPRPAWILSGQVAEVRERQDDPVEYGQQLSLAEAMRI